MIRVPGENCTCPVELFSKQHPHKLMRQSQRAEAQKLIRPRPDRRVKAIRAADHKTQASCSVFRQLLD